MNRIWVFVLLFLGVIGCVEESSTFGSPIKPNHWKVVTTLPNQDISGQGFTITNTFDLVLAGGISNGTGYVSSEVQIFRKDPTTQAYVLKTKAYLPTNNFFSGVRRPTVYGGGGIYIFGGDTPTSRAPVPNSRVWQYDEPTISFKEIATDPSPSPYNYTGATSSGQLFSINHRGPTAQMPPSYVPPPPSINRLFPTASVTQINEFTTPGMVGDDYSGVLYFFGGYGNPPSGEVLRIDVTAGTTVTTNHTVRFREGGLALASGGLFYLFGGKGIQIGDVESYNPLSGGMLSRSDLTPPFDLNNPKISARAFGSTVLVQEQGVGYTLYEFTP